MNKLTRLLLLLAWILNGLLLSFNSLSSQLRGYSLCSSCLPAALWALIHHESVSELPCVDSEKSLYCYNQPRPVVYKCTGSSCHFFGSLISWWVSCLFLFCFVFSPFLYVGWVSVRQCWSIYLFMGEFLSCLTRPVLPFHVLCLNWLYPSQGLPSFPSWWYGLPSQ